VLRIRGSETSTFLASHLSDSTLLETAMKTLFLSVALGAALLLSTGAYADAPAGAIAQCKDGTYFTGTSHNGACKGHQGVKTWLDKTSATPAAAPAAAPATGAMTKKTTSAPTTTAASTSAPAGAIAKCKDGTYFNGTSHNGACKGHQGVADWLDKSPTGAATPVAPSKPTPASVATPATPATAAVPATKATAPTPPTPASQITQKAGGGAGLVWVNSSSKVYHCQGDEWYGKTKEGSYMTAAQAEAAGNHASGGKPCK
jgi:uncharacterized protein DUF3761